MWNNPMIKNILHTIIIGSTIIFLCGTTKAQPMKMSVDDRVKLLTEQLSLSKLQADSVRIIYQRADSLRTKLFESRQGDRTGMRESMRIIQDSADVKVEILLTKEQKEKFSELRKQRQQRRGPPPESRPNRE